MCDCTAKQGHHVHRSTVFLALLAMVIGVAITRLDSRTGHHLQHMHISSTQQAWVRKSRLQKLQDSHLEMVKTLPLYGLMCHKWHLSPNLCCLMFTFCFSFQSWHILPLVPQYHSVTGSSNYKLWTCSSFSLVMPLLSDGTVAVLKSQGSGEWDEVPQ